MAVNQRRAENLLRGLSAKERATIALRDFKAGIPQAEDLLRTAPTDQHTEFGRLIDLVHTINSDLAFMTVVLGEAVEKALLRFACLSLMTQRALELWLVRAETDVEAHERNAEASFVTKILDEGAWYIALPLNEDRAARAGEGPYEAMVRKAAIQTRHEAAALSKQLRAISNIVSRTNIEFDGEDVLRPEARASLDTSLRHIAELHAGLQEFLGEFELPEPDEEVSRLMERLLARRPAALTVVVHQ